MMVAPSIAVRVDNIVKETDRIKSYRLLAVNGTALPKFKAGAHVDVSIPNGLVRQYSLCNTPSDQPDHYEIAVQREDAGRGGSISMHDNVKEGDVLVIGHPRNHFPLRGGSEKIFLLAGGICITPLLSMARQLENENCDFELHYCCQTSTEAAFHTRLLSDRFSGKVHHHFSHGPQPNRLDLDALLAVPQSGGHIYCCGPQRFISAVATAAAAWGEERVFVEHFTPVTLENALENQPFDIIITSTGQTLHVPADKTILQVLHDHGIEKESQCKDGLCGSCETGLLSGDADHRDSIQTEEEKLENTCIMVCCSRARSVSLTLDI